MVSLIFSYFIFYPESSLLNLYHSSTNSIGLNNFGIGMEGDKFLRRSY
jgi:hypothetical protein